MVEYWQFHVAQPIQIWTIRQNFDHVGSFSGLYIRHCNRGGSTSLHCSQIAYQKADGCIFHLSSWTQSPTFSITHSFTNHVPCTYRSQRQCCAPIPSLCLWPSTCPWLSLSVSTPSVCSPSLILLPVLVCQPLPLHITCWACFPPNVNPIPTLLSLYPFPCFRGTCLDSGPLGGKRGGKRCLRSCWVVRRRRSS